MNKMSILIISLVLIAAGVTFFLYGTEKGNTVNYGATNVNHIVSVDSNTFYTLTKYAFGHNITVTDTIALMSKTFPPQNVTIGRVVKLNGDNLNVETSSITCSTTTVGYNPIQETGKYVYTLMKVGTTTLTLPDGIILPAGNYLRIDKILFPDGSPDIVIECTDTTPLTQ